TPMAPPALDRVMRRPSISLPSVNPLAPTSQIIRSAYASGSATPTPTRTSGRTPICSAVATKIQPTSCGTSTTVAITESISAARNRVTGGAGVQPSSGGSISWPVLAAPGALTGEPGPLGAPGAEPG